MDFSGIGAPGQDSIEGAREAIETSSSIVERGEGRLLLGNADAFDSNRARVFTASSPTGVSASCGLFGRKRCWAFLAAFRRTDGSRGRTILAQRSAGVTAS